MFKALFNIIINMLASIVQIVVWPLNQLVSNLFPDLSSQILQVTNTLNTVFDAITWPLGLLPSSVITVLLFIIGIEIIKHTIYISTDKLLKVWNLFQKLKFW